MWAVALSCWYVQSSPKTLFPYLIAIGKTSRMYLSELSTGQAVLVSCPVLSCRTGVVFYFCPVLPPARMQVGSRTGQDWTKKCSSELSTGQAVLVSCPVGQDAFLVFVLSCRPPGSRTGQKSLSCAHL